MRKTTLMLLSILLTLSTVGCSGNGASKVSSDGSNIYVDGKLASLSEFDGTKALYTKDLITVIYTSCVPEIRNCVSNKQGVHEGDLSKYKDSNYFTAYMDTTRVVHIVKKDRTIEASIVTQDTAKQTVDSVFKDVYNTMGKLVFEPIQEATFADKVVVKSNGGVLTVRNDSIVVNGVLAVSNNTKSCTQQVEIGGVTVMMYESKGFKFYQYGDILIKIGKSYNVEDYITLK